MSSPRKLTKIVKQVEGETELKFQPREIYSSWSCEVIINSDCEVLEVRDIDIMTYDRDGEEIYLDDEDQDQLLTAVKKEAAEKAIESLDLSDFEDSEEQY